MNFYRGLLLIIFYFLLLITRSSIGSPLPALDMFAHAGQAVELANGGLKTATAGADVARAGTAALDAAKIADVGGKAETLKGAATGAQTLSELRGVDSAAHGLEGAGHLKDAAAGHALTEGGEAAKGLEAAKVGEGALDEAKTGEGALVVSKTEEGALDGAKIGEGALDGAKTEEGALVVAKTGESVADGAKVEKGADAVQKSVKTKMMEGFKNLKGMKLKDVAQSAKVRFFGEENKVMSNLVGKDVTDLQKADEIWNGMSDAQKLEKTSDTVRALLEHRTTTNELELAKMSKWLEGADKSRYFETVANGADKFATLSGDLHKAIKMDQAAKARGLFTTVFKWVKWPFSKTKRLAGNLAGKMFLEFMYHINPTALLPEVRVAMKAKKAEVTKIGKFARLIGGNPKGWMPALQTGRQAGGFAVSPAGRLLAGAKSYFGAGKEAAAVTDGAAHAAKGADAAEAALIAKKSEDTVGAGLGTAGTASHVAAGSGGMGKTAVQQAGVDARVTQAVV